VTGFHAETDAEGRWTINRVAPELVARLSGEAKHPDHGYEHEVRLSPALVISGTVFDAATHEPIPHFSITCGWPAVRYGVASPQWSTSPFLPIPPPG
jgi:hypothetical protein